MATLILMNNSASNSQTLDLSGEIDVQRGDGMDVSSPTFSERVFTHSLLKEGATFALENVGQKEVIFPLLVGANQGFTTASQVAARVQQINHILQTPGATASWQDDGMTQASYFSLNSGQLDVEYDFRSQGSAHFSRCKMRLFTQPFVTPSAPRVYAAASGIGPLLIISPYASGGALTIAASTQAGVAGYGGKPAGPSTGIFYGGNPSLAGDAPALLQISYTGPLPTGATVYGAVPQVAVSFLPDNQYRPLVTANQIRTGGGAALTLVNVQTAVASQYVAIGNAQPGAGRTFAIAPFAGASVLDGPPVTWAGDHRMFAIARASNGPGFITTIGGPAVPLATAATVWPGDWQLMDLGVTTVITQETQPKANLNFGTVNMYAGNAAGAAASVAVDITAFVVLPDAQTWYLNPRAISASQYGPPPLIQGDAPWTNTILIDDTLPVPDQFLFRGAALKYAPSPAGMVASSARITQYTRGIVPRPDPLRGVPIIAILGVCLISTPSQIVSLSPAFPAYTVAGASWVNPQNLPSYAQVSVVERARYLLN